MKLIHRVFHFLFPGAAMNRSLRILVVLNMVFTFIVGVVAPFNAVLVIKIGGDVP